MTYAQIGQCAKPKVSAMTVSNVIRGKCKTLNIPLAQAISKITGEAPVVYLNEKIKDLAVQIHPSLKRRPACSKGS